MVNLLDLNHLWTDIYGYGKTSWHWTINQDFAELKTLNIVRKLGWDHCLTYSYYSLYFGEPFPFTIVWLSVQDVPLTDILAHDKVFWLFSMSHWNLLWILMFPRELPQSKNFPSYTGYISVYIYPVNSVDCCEIYLHGPQWMTPLHFGCPLRTNLNPTCGGSQSSITKAASSNYTSKNVLGLW